MRSRQKTLSPLFRSLAALALMVFAAAQALCFVHCNFGGGHGDKAQPSCHGSPQTTASHNGHDGSVPAAPAKSATCSTLKTMLAGGDAPTLVVPQLHPLYLLAPITLALDAIQELPDAPFTRQAGTGDWVFTPLVCLGPAFHSLAPPFLS